MAEIKMGSTRGGYGKALVELGELHENIVVLDADLADSTRTGFFRKAFPNRHFNCGIAEANMMAAAAGLATTGLVPFASTFAMFAVGRAYDQVRNSIGYPRLNVKIGASHSGLSVGDDGASHQFCEDFALMRAIPGMVVICPADEAEARAMVHAAYAHQGPVYMRFSRLDSPVIHQDGYQMTIGKGELLRDGKDVTIFATGLMVWEALEAARALAEQGVDARVVNMATIKPLDEELVLKAAREKGLLLTVEEHSIIGGLGDAVAACLAEKHPARLVRIGVNDMFGHSGPAAALLKEFGLSAENIVAKVLANK